VTDSYVRRLLGGPPTGTPSPVTLLGPDAVTVDTDRLTVGEGCCRTFAVVGYPREVGYGWLEPLTATPTRVDVSLHIAPTPVPIAADRLRRQLARLESTRRDDATHGRLANPDIDVAAEDARSLADGLARGNSRLFRVGLTITVHAASPRQLDAECVRIRGVCAGMLLDLQPATFRQLQGWQSSLPVGVDQLSLHRTFDTAALAAAYPFANADPTTTNGVLYGTTVAGSGLLLWDRFAQDNHNSVILARSGAGKSYLAKLEALRSLYRGIDVLIIDPEDEYDRLTDAVGGLHLQLGTPNGRLNPFDLPTPTTGEDVRESDAAGRGDPLTRRALFLHTLIGVLLGGPLDPAAAAVLDRAILAAYAAAGITGDFRTHRRPAPLLADLTDALDTDSKTTGDPAGSRLAGQLAPYVTGSYRRLFDGPTTTMPTGHLVVYSLAGLPEELKAAGTMLVLDAIWRTVSNPADRRRRLVVVDEAWLLMADPQGARFLFHMAKAARKHWAGLTVVTQDAADLLGTPLGQAVVANAATQVLLRQAPQTIDVIGDAFALSAGERSYLLAAPQGAGLLAAGTTRIAFQALASPTEHRLITTNPAELTTDDDGYFA
jgi:type IV secretory pathway VirB4 component